MSNLRASDSAGPGPRDNSACSISIHATGRRNVTKENLRAFAPHDAAYVLCGGRLLFGLGVPGS